MRRVDGRSTESDERWRPDAKRLGSSLPDVLARICANTRAEVAVAQVEDQLEALRYEIAHARRPAARLRLGAEGRPVPAADTG